MNVNFELLKLNWGQPIYITSMEVLDQHLSLINKITYMWSDIGIKYIYGCDVEWTNDNKAALIQFALPLDINGTNGIVILLHVSQMQPDNIILTQELSNFLKSTIAVGVGVDNDIKLIATLFHDESNSWGYIELCDLALLIGIKSNIQGHTLGLANLTQMCLNYDLIKDKYIRCSDWTITLTKEQITYAALDAYSSYCCALKCCIDLLTNSSEWFNPLINYNTNIFKKTFKKTFKKSSKKSKFIEKSRILYDNCKMFNVDGIHISNISRHRCLWYIKLGKAKYLCDEHHDTHSCSIQVNFITKAISLDNYNLEPKKFCCVGCGLNINKLLNNLYKVSIIPLKFKHELPISVKSRNSHDVILLCRKCKNKLCIPIMKYKTMLFKSHNLEDFLLPTKVNNEFRRVCSAANAIKRNNTCMQDTLNNIMLNKKNNCCIPQERLIILLKILANHCHKSDIMELNNSDLDKCLAINYINYPEQKELLKSIHKDKTPENIYMIQEGIASSCFSQEKITDNIKPKIQAFVEGWRNVFFNTIKPKFLPKGWSINRPI